MAKVNADQELIEYSIDRDVINIDNITKETRIRLFKLWSLGVSYDDLIHMYERTSEEITSLQLLKIAELDNWVENRKNLIDQKLAEMEISQKIVQINRLESVNKMLFWCNEEIFNEMKAYLDSNRDPEKKPAWMPKNQKDIETLLNLHNVISKDSNIGMYQFLQDNSRVNNFNIQTGSSEPELDDNGLVEALKILADQKTKTFINNSRVKIETKPVTNEK